MSATPKKIRAIWNKTLAADNNIKRILPTEEYLRNEVLGIGNPGAGLENLGPIHWQLVLCYLLGWIFVGLTLSKGVKSSGKVVYFTATFPYVVLIILLIRGVLLDGYYDGIKFYIEPDLSILKSAKVWKEAANQIFFSLSASWGGLIALASYNKFHNDTFSVFAGFVIFSYLGFLANNLNEPVNEVASGGTTLAFVVYPFAVTKMPFVAVFSWIDYQRVDKLPKWADALGWLMTLSVILAIIVTAIVKVVMAGGNIRQVLRPTPDWGPALPRHRQLCTKYVPNFVVDPNNTDTAQADGLPYQIPNSNKGDEAYSTPYDPPPQFDSHRL
nr:hypothetical protein BaRGS_010821 [Batillaria attramentaria]